MEAVTFLSPISYEARENAHAVVLEASEDMRGITLLLVGAAEKRNEGNRQWHGDSDHSASWSPLKFTDKVRRQALALNVGLCSTAAGPH